MTASSIRLPSRRLGRRHRSLGRATAPRSGASGRCAGAVLLLAAVVALPDAALSAVPGVSPALGAAFVLLGYDFVRRFRALRERGNGRAIGTSFLMPGVAALVVLRGARSGTTKPRKAAIVGALAALLFLVSSMPWGITVGLTLWGAKTALPDRFDW